MKKSDTKLHIVLFQQYINLPRKDWRRIFQNQFSYLYISSQPAMHPSMHTPIHPSIHPYTLGSIHLSIHLSTHPHTHISIDPSVHPCIHKYIHPLTHHSPIHSFHEYLLIPLYIYRPWDDHWDYRINEPHKSIPWPPGAICLVRVTAIQQIMSHTGS